jgi:ABC-type polysaccharide/polyol phosphate export permease
MLAVTSAQLNTAVVDVRDGALAWRLSWLLAWQDIKQRYRRSTLGPIWLTISSGIQMLTMSLLSSFLFGTTISKSVPFVFAGLLFWGMITNIINDGATLFVSSSSYIIQIKRPLTIFLMQAILRNIIVAAHNAVTYVIVALCFAVIPDKSIILWPLGFVLVLICVSSIALIAAVVSARFRDVPLIIQNVLTIIFWFTPLIYFPEQLGPRRYLADYNPFTHIIALLREPLLGSSPTLNDWLAVLGLAIVGWLCAFLFFARFRARIVYWL